MELINIIRLARLCEDQDALLPALVTWGLVPEEGTSLCPKFRASLKLYKDVSRTDGWRWNCKNITLVRKQKRRLCNTCVEFRKGTFFERSHLSLFQILGYVNLWVGNVSLVVIRQQLEIAEHGSVDWGSFCREVILDAFIVNSVKLGGYGLTVEINVSKFGRRKYHRGHRVEGQLVFGGYKRETGRMFVVPVEDRGAGTPNHPTRN